LTVIGAPPPHLHAAAEKLPQQRGDGRELVLEDIVAAIAEEIFLRLGKPLAPLLIKDVVEAEIQPTPQQQQRNLHPPQDLEAVFDLHQGAVTAISRMQGNVADEFMDGDPVAPGVVRGDIGPGHVGRQFGRHRGQSRRPANKKPMFRKRLARARGRRGGEN